MKIARGDLLNRLNECAAGLSSSEVVEQSNSFIFVGKYLITFNDDVMVRTKNPFPFDMVVTAQDFMGILTKIPDDEVDIELDGGEVRISGRKRQAGLSVAEKTLLPIDMVPKPGNWSDIPDGVAALLQQAARTCGKDETMFVATCVHITPDYIEGCDNHRLFRANVKTGFPEDVLIPAQGVHAVEDMEIEKVSMGEGWVHFKTMQGSIVSVRCSHQKYHEKVGEFLKMDKTSTTRVEFPSNLKEVLERAEVMSTAAYDTKVHVGISEGLLTLTARKDTGWYKERKKIRYEGPELNFEINPKFFAEMLDRAQEVRVDSRKMKITADHIECVTSLWAKKEMSDKEKKEREEAKMDVAADDEIPF